MKEELNIYGPAKRLSGAFFGSWAVGLQVFTLDDGAGTVIQGRGKETKFMTEEDKQVVRDILMEKVKEIQLSLYWNPSAPTLQICRRKYGPLALLWSALARLLPEM
jgi:hypothetical protein